MSNKKFKYEELIASFDHYEEKFAHDLDDKFLIGFFDNFEDKLKASKFSDEELLKIKARLEKMMAMFADKKEELRGKSVDILERQDQLNRYVTNSNLKK
jgi:hypothetical protein